MGDEEMTRAEEVAKRATELAARAEELARHAHEVAGVDEQLAALEAELDALAAEEEALDGDLGDTRAGGAAGDAHDGDFGDGGVGGHGGDRGTGDASTGAGPDDEWAGWTGTFGDRMEALGERLGDLISGSLDAAFYASMQNPSPMGRGRRYQLDESEKVVPVTGPLPVTVASQGGHVNVRPGPSDRVTVTWRTRGRSSGIDDPDAVTVTERDGTLSIESKSGRGWRPNVVRVDVEVPVRSPVDVTTGGGSLRIEGTQAAVRARTGGGSIHISEVDGEVSATTGGGSIRVEGRLRGPSNIRTGGGSVAVVVSRDTRIDVDAQGTAASIDVPGLKVHGLQVSGAVGGGGDGTLEIRTGGGSARISQA